MNAPIMVARTALTDRLIELASVIADTDDETYRSARADRVSGSIGAHVRHVIDHVAALVEAPVPGVVDYDTRRRGTDVERSRSIGMLELERLARRVKWLPASSLAAGVELSAVVDGTGRRVAAQSTVARELVFVLSHTIHHQAIIALLLASAGQSTPERFGLAPSTPGRLSCAQSA